MAFPLMFLPAAFQFAVGAGQTIKGLTMKEGERPEYEIPETAEAALANAKYIASQTKLPGEDLIQDRMKENMANAIFTTTQAAQDPSQILAGAQKITEAFNNQQVDMGIKGAEFYYQNQGQLRGELNRMAEREDTKWTLNEYNPYMENKERKQALTGGGLENLQGGLNSFLGVTQYNDFLKSLKGTNQFEGIQPTGTNPTGTPVPTYQDPMKQTPVAPQNTGFDWANNPFGKPNTSTAPANSGNPNDPLNLTGNSIFQNNPFGQPI